MRYDTKIEGFTLDRFDARLRRDWAIRIFAPTEWHGHLLDAPAPVKMEAFPKTLIQVGYVFTQQTGADQVDRVGWVYAEEEAKGIRIEADIQPPHALNFAQWLQDRFGVTAKEQPDADQAPAQTPEDSKPGNPARRAHTKAIRRLQEGQPKQQNRLQWATEYEAETGTHPEAMKTGEAELYRLKVWRPYRKQAKN